MTAIVELALSALLAGGGFAGLWAGYVARRRRDHPAAGPLSMISFLPGIGGFCYAALVFVHDPVIARALIATGNFIVYVAPGYFLLFAIQYTGRGAWLTPRRRAVILGAFAVNGVLSALEPLYLSDLAVRTVNGLTLHVVQDTQLTSTLVLVANYPGVVVGFVLLGGFLVAPQNMYRKQTLVISLAILLTAIGNLVFQVGLGLHPGLDTTILFFSAQSVLIILALFRFEFLRLEPLAPEVVLEELADPVVVLGEDRHVVSTNPAADDVLAAGAGVGVPLDDAVPGLSAAIAADGEYRRAASDGPSADSPSDVYHVHEAPITDPYGRDRGAAIVMRDITPQKERERTFQALQSATQRFLRAESKADVFEVAVETAETVLEYPYSGAMRYDADANVLRPAVFTDRLVAAYEALDSDVDPVVGPGGGDVWSVFESGDPQVGSPIQAEVEEKIPIESGGGLLYPLGDHGVLGISAGPDHESFDDDERRFVDILATTTVNALDRVVKERQLASQRDTLEVVNQMVRHDIRNDLQLISAYGETLHAHVDGAGAEHVEMLLGSVREAVAITERARDVTELTLREDASLEPVAVRPILVDAVEEVERMFDDAVITVDGTIPHSTVVANDMLSSVFRNLLRNAVIHNDEDVPRVTVAAAERDGALRVTVADNGPGIPDHRKGRLFEKGEMGLQSDGTGIGTYLVQTLVSQYDGDVWVEDNDPKGAVFCVRLPVAVDRIDDEPRA